jgi:cobalt/nickel transport system ATP-binding protein
MSHGAVHIENLHFAYPDGTDALQGISLALTEGECVGIVGENGAGKSTLFLHLVGYLTPSQGTISIGTTQVTRKTLREIRQRVGMVFQDTDDQLFMPTVQDEVAFGPLNLGLGEDEVARRVLSAIRQVGVEHLRDRAPHRLSGGEKRAVTLAAVLSMQPDVLVLDEPTANLDPKSRRQVIGLMNSFDHTQLVATHDLDLVMDTCSRTIVLHEGRVAADGSPAAIFSDEELLARCHLEKPLRMQACPVCGAKA